MIKLHTKPNCPFCQRLKQELNTLDVSYDEIYVKNKAVPCLYEDDQLIFKGLPAKQDLYDFINNRKSS